MKKDNKREIAIFNQLKDRVPEYLMQNEFIEAEYFMVTDIYASVIFLTNLRAIILKPGNSVGGFGKPKVKKVIVEPINYSNIETISYNEGILGYDTITIKIKGSFVNHTLSVNKNTSKNLYSDLNNKTMFSSTPLEPKDETPKQESLSKKELKKVKQNEEKELKRIQREKEKEIAKEKGKEAAKKAASYLGEKTLQFGKWGAKQVKNKSEQIINDMKEKKENN